MSDLPPADWYTDPEDDRQYRYWDGESWTEHRAPRRLDNKPRPTGELIGDSVSMIRRHWRVYAVVIAATAVIAAAISEVGLRIGVDALDGFLGGRLDEIAARLSSPDFDPTTPEDREYLDSIRIDLNWEATGQAALGMLVILFSSLLGLAAVARAAVADLGGRAPTAGDALRGGLVRLGRVAGVWLQIMAAIAAVLSFPPNLGGLVYAALACSYSTGESMPALEWRRWRLYHWSIQAATSRRAWWRVA